MGGKFTQVKRWNQPAVFTRNNIFAYDKATGAIDTSFVPQLDGQVTGLLRAADGKVYVSGQFRNVNGVAGGYLVKLDPANGVRDMSFNASPTGMVYDIHLHGNTLFAVGTFTRIRNLVRTNFAMVNAATGQAVGADVPFITAATGTTRVMRLDVTPDGSTLVAVGNFTSRWAASSGRTSPSWTSAAPRPRSATGSPTATGTASARPATTPTSATSTSRPTAPTSASSTTGAYRAPPLLCDSAARWETAATGTATPTWVDYTGGDSLSSVAITGAAMYVAGHQRWHNNAVPSAGDRIGPGGVDRLGIAALDVESGVPLSWNPTRERGLTAWRMTPTADGLYVMSDSNHMSR